MGCVTSIPSESNMQPHSVAKDQCRDTDKRSDAGELEIPPFYTKWFPSGHAHTDIRKRFKYHAQIATGSYSSVHHIEYKSEKCILKQIPKDNESSRMIFETEAQILSKLHHRGIISLIDVFLDEEYYYLVLQKADYDLQTVLKKKIHLSENKTRQIVYSLLETIEFIHGKNLVHRDIKPENITFIANDTDHPLIIDFGDAEMVQNDKLYYELVGTPPYMSPERLQHHKGWELKKSDIWAVGAIAYEMHCGQRCFKGNTQKQVFSKVLSGDWSWHHERCGSDQFKDFITKCLELDPKDRLSATDALNHEWFASMNRK